MLTVRWLVVLWVTLVLGISTGWTSELEMRQAEDRLLHRRLDLSGLLLWDRGTGKWGPAPSGAHKGGMVLLHLWAVECTPCKPELAELRPVLRNLQKRWPIKVIVASETLDQQQLSQWLKDNQERIPEADQYQNVDNKVRRVLQDHTWPLTLLLDQEGVIRHAFVGSLSGRIGEFLDVVDRLAPALHLTPLATPAGPGLDGSETKNGKVRREAKGGKR